MSVDIWILISFLMFIAVVFFTSRRTILNSIDNKIQSISQAILESRQIKSEAATDLKAAIQELKRFEKRKKEIVNTSEKRIKLMQKEAKLKEKSLAQNRQRMLAQAINQHKEQERIKLKNLILQSAISEVESAVKNNKDLIDNMKIYQHQPEVINQLRK